MGQGGSGTQDRGSFKRSREEGVLNGEAFSEQVEEIREPAKIFQNAYLECVLTVRSALRVLPRVRAVQSEVHIGQIYCRFAW